MLDISIRYVYGQDIRVTQMFDLKDALASADVYNLDFDQLDDLLRRIRREHLAEISPEIGVRELMTIGLEHGWIVENDDGRFQIQIPVAA